MAASRADRRGARSRGTKALLRHVPSGRPGAVSRESERPHVPRRQRLRSHRLLQGRRGEGRGDDAAGSRDVSPQAVRAPGALRVRFPLDGFEPHDLPQGRVRRVRHDLLCRTASRRGDPPHGRDLFAPREGVRRARLRAARQDREDRGVAARVRADGRPREEGASRAVVGYLFVHRGPGGRRAHPRGSRCGTPGDDPAPSDDRAPSPQTSGSARRDASLAQGRHRHERAGVAAAVRSDDQRLVRRRARLRVRARAPGLVRRHAEEDQQPRVRKGRPLAARGIRARRDRRDSSDERDRRRAKADRGTRRRPRRLPRANPCVAPAMDLQRGFERRRRRHIATLAFGGAEKRQAEAR